MSLNDFLEKMREASWGKWPSKNRAIVERASADLASSGILDRILKVGDTAPDFTLSNAKGVDVNLHGLLAGGPQQPSAGGPQQPLVGGPVVIAFYRGHWWRYCNAELSALQQLLEEIQSLGAHLIAISPQVTKESRVTSEKSGLTFHLLSDLGNKVARSFGLVFQLPPDLREIYLRLGIDLSVSNGDDSFELPIPATYVIDRGGVIRAVRADADYVKRMEPSDIVTALKSISADVA